jgi:hypothetical protein
MSEEEKKSIREQHSGGMKVMTENFSKLLNSKLGDSKPLVNEQNVLNDIVYARTEFVNALKKYGWKFSPNGVQSPSAFKPKGSDLMVSGYDGKPLVFQNNLSSCYLSRDGITIICTSLNEPLKKYKLPQELDKFINKELSSNL